MKIRETTELVHSEHELVTYKGFITGRDAECITCTDPDYDDGWTGSIYGIYNATDQEIEDWFHDHVLEQEGR